MYEEDEEPNDCTLAETVPEKYKKRFRKACAELNKIQADMIADGFPETNYYLQEDDMCLMIGPSHDDSKGQRENHHNVAESVYLPGSGGGAW